jgi:hypothetical protein
MGQFAPVQPIPQQGVDILFLERAAGILFPLLGRPGLGGQPFLIQQPGDPGGGTYP